MRALPLFLLLPSPLWAEVCDKEPDWDGGRFPALTAALDFWLSIPGWMMAAVFLMAVLANRRATTLIALAAGLMPMVWLYRFDQSADVRAAAIREGCAGHPWLLILTLCAPALLLIRRS